MDVDRRFTLLLFAGLWNEVTFLIQSFVRDKLFTEKAFAMQGNKEFRGLSGKEEELFVFLSCMKSSLIVQLQFSKKLQNFLESLGCDIGNFNEYLLMDIRSRGAKDLKNASVQAALAVKLLDGIVNIDDLNEEKLLEVIIATILTVFNKDTEKEELIKLTKNTFKQVADASSFMEELGEVKIEKCVDNTIKLMQDVSSDKDFKKILTKILNPEKVEKTTSKKLDVDTFIDFALKEKKLEDREDQSKISEDLL
jgi:hypothetical protein